MIDLDDPENESIELIAFYSHTEESVAYFEMDRNILTNFLELFERCEANFDTVEY